MITSTIKIMFDASVFALAQDSELYRTGIYFVLKNLVEALSAEKEAELDFFFQEGLHRGKLTEALPKALRSVRLTADPATPKLWDWSKEKINFFTGFYPLPVEFVAKARNGKLYQMVHDVAGHACPEFKEPSFEQQRSFERSLVSGLGTSGHAFCVSDCTKNDLNKYFGLPFDRMTVVHPAVRSDFVGRERGDQESRALLSKLNIPAHARYVLALATLEPRKNVATSLRAFQRIVEQSGQQDLYLVFAGAHGWGDWASFFQTLPPPVSHRIILTGYVSDDVLPTLLSRALCLVYPSLYEGFGLPVLEAMSFGTPVVASNRGALPEVIDQGGRMFDAHDAEGIAQSILTLLRNPGQRIEWSSRARKQASTFSWESAASKILGTIRSRLHLTELVEGNGTRTSHLGRNQACPCGSGKKYKHCHGRFT